MTDALIEILFAAMDVNGDGSITKDEMNEVFKSFDADGMFVKVLSASYFIYSSSTCTSLKRGRVNV